MFYGGFSVEELWVFGGKKYVLFGVYWGGIHYVDVLEFCLGFADIDMLSFEDMLWEKKVLQVFGELKRGSKGTPFKLVEEVTRS